MLLASMSDMARLNFRLARTEPLLSPPFPSPILADPSFLLPGQGPDDSFHLFAHSILGIHHYESKDGFAFRRLRTLTRAALRPFIHAEGGRYRLFYEALLHAPFPFCWMPGARWRSRLECIESTDLRHWSKPTALFEPSLPFHDAGKLGRTVSNPCLVRCDKGYRLYYSAGMTYLSDCGFHEPTYIAVAESDTPVGPFRLRDEPLLGPDKDDPWCNLGAGSMKVLRVADGWVAFQNGIYWSKETNHSGSAIRLLGSTDGLRWEVLRKDPILAPTTGWMRSHVYALDVRFHQKEGRYYIYFNARDDWWRTKGREAIGLLWGEST